MAMWSRIRAEIGPTGMISTPSVRIGEGFPLTLHRGSGILETLRGIAP